MFHFSDSCLTYLLVQKNVRMQYEIVQLSEFLLTHETIEVTKGLILLFQILKKAKTFKSQRKKNLQFFNVD